VGRKQEKGERDEETETGTEAKGNRRAQELPGRGHWAFPLHPHGSEVKEMKNTRTNKAAVTAPSRGRYINSGNGPSLLPIDIGHEHYMGLVDPDTAFWSLVRKDSLAETLTNTKFLAAYQQKADSFADEMSMLRFHLKPSAVYFNATEKCNLDCTYCYIPATMRRSGVHMQKAEVFSALRKLRTYFRKVVPPGVMPQIIFHGAEPLLNRDAIFAAIEHFKNDFRFGIQTNATLLDPAAIEFLTSHGTGIGLSLDGHTASICDKTRATWDGKGVFEHVVTAMERLKGYAGYNVICTVTDQNMRHLSKIVEFFHAHEVPACLLNIVRCTLKPARDVKPTDHAAAKYFIAALEKADELYRQTGRKLVVGNFANILVSILAPTARRLMCDISPCGGGRCFFALAPNGDLFPCSEFIGLPRFKGGNLFTDKIADVLESEAFKMVTGRKVEDITPCNRCAIRHFCGSPCPAEAHEVNGAMDKVGSFCEFYEEQARYALRLIADNRQDAFLWDHWDTDTDQTFKFSG